MLAIAAREAAQRVAGLRVLSARSSEATDRVAAGYRALLVSRPDVLDAGVRVVQSPCDWWTSMPREEPIAKSGGTCRSTSMSIDYGVDGSETVNARSRFFPFWWMGVGLERETGPIYQVICSSPEELALAQSVRPDEVRAEFRLTVLEA